jgi:hypothetical protein
LDECDRGLCMDVRKGVRDFRLKLGREGRYGLGAHIYLARTGGLATRDSIAEGDPCPSAPSRPCDVQALTRGVGGEPQRARRRLAR